VEMCLHSPDAPSWRHARLGGHRDRDPTTLRFHHAFQHNSPTLLRFSEQQLKTCDRIVFILRFRYKYEVAQHRYFHDPTLQSAGVRSRTVHASNVQAT